MPMDMRGTVIIRSLAIMATATAIGVGSGRPSERTVTNPTHMEEHKCRGI
jgi:hypothetical protein